MTNEESIWAIAYGADDEVIPDKLQGEEPIATLFKMIRVLARELLLLETVYEEDHSDD